MKFTKMQGLGNDYVYVNCFEEKLENPSEIFENFVTAIDKSFDPSFPFMIMAIILFLLDIAVRKFKFKWPHELIREYKEKKSSE